MRITAGWQGDADSLITGWKDPMRWNRVTASVQAWMMLVNASQREIRAHSSSSGFWFITANTRSTHHSVPVHLQTCFASLPLVTLHTKKRGENQSPHKKSRWEYIIRSEKQFVLAISCLCAKVIPLSSSISAGSSYWVGGGHYTTWLQNLHRPLQRPGSLSEWNPRWCRLCQIVFWLRLSDNGNPLPTFPGFIVPLSYILQSIYLCKSGGGAYSLLGTSISLCKKLVLK